MRRTVKLLALFATCSLLASPFVALAAGAEKTSSLSSQDKQFITKAARAGYAEVAAGKLASSKATDPEVKRFGEQMVQDHTKAGDELKQIAETKGVAVAIEPDAVHKGFVKRLERLQGKQFDRSYIREAGVKDHKQAVNLFTAQAKKGRDAELKAYAERTLPTIQRHYQMAQDLSSAVSRKK